MNPLFTNISIIALPLLEIAGFIIVGKAIGIFLTLLLVIVTTLMGIFLLRGGGIIALWKMRQNQSEMLSMLQGSLTIMSGMLLIIPGFITDIMGLLLLLPPVQKIVLRKLLAANIAEHGHAQGHRVIQGEFSRKDDS